MFMVKQGRRRVAEYALEFHMLAAESSWNEAALKPTFCQRLNNNALTELLYHNETATLHMLTDLAICLDNLLQDCK